MPTAPFHTPVLLNEVLSFLVTAPEGIYVDATLGGGGHAEAVLERLNPSGRLIGFDADEDALAASREQLMPFGSRFTGVRENFGNLAEALKRLGVDQIQGIVFDLGVSSFQLDTASKGFSFRTDDRLDMRIDRSHTRDAVDVLNGSSADELTRILREYGEEKHAKRIANRIVRERAHGRIERSGELSRIVEEVVGSRFLAKSLARVFQAIRIEVNEELIHLERGLAQAVDLLAPGGRVVAIAYHSLEDRIVKKVFKADAATSVPSGTPLLPNPTITPTLKILTRKPLEASKTEQSTNPRSRSAKLRAAERLSLWQR